VKKEIFEKIREERMLYSYEDFAVVDYVNVSLDPYCSAWEAKGKIISKKVEKKIITSTLKKTVIEKEQKTFAQFHKTRASQEKIEALQKEMDNELQQLNYFYEQAKENLQFPSLNNTEEKYASSAIDKELEEMVAFDWAYKQYLFNDQDTYGPKVMDKVAAYTEAVMHYASLQDFDVIHAHDWLTFPAAVAIKKQSKKPLVIHVHSLETDRTTNPQARNTVYDIEKKAMGMANMVVSVSQYTKECIEKNYQIESHKIQAVHNGIEPYNPALKATPKTVNTILFLGRVTPQKGILYLIETASILLKKIENVQFLIAGIGDQLREAMLLSQQKGISDKIKFLGFLSQEKVKETLAETDVFFMPSVSEPFGLAALEAAQFGIPLVLSKQTGAAELLPNSLRANYWETEKFANYLYATLQYKGLKNELRNATLEDVNYATWEVSATAVHQIYKKVIADEFTDNLAPRKND